MIGLTVRWGRCALALVAPIFLSGCLITAPGVYFTSVDFVQPKVLTGDWTSVPADSTDRTADVINMRIGLIENGLHRAQPLKRDRTIDADEEPSDFGVVELGPGDYLVVETEDEGDSIRSGFIGLHAEEGKLTFMRFGGGDTPQEEEAYTRALTATGLMQDHSMKYELRLAGNITKDKIKALFKVLMTSPQQYGADVSVFTTWPG